MVEVDAGERARRAVDRLLRLYRPGAGWLRPAPGDVWQLALAIEAALTAYQQTGEPAYLAAVRRWFGRQGGRRSRFYDDDAWYVNAWLRGYEVTGDEEFLAEGRAGFADLTAGWDDVCGGGLWWSQDRTYKNAITNELFLLAAARLARLGEGGAPLTRLADGAADWADRAWRWFDGSGLINSDHLVNDGLDQCRNNGGTTWTYNQGVLISALVELGQLTGDPRHLARAGQIARASVAHLARDGILREPSEPACDRDQEIFKGILAQGVGRLCRADPTATADLAQFLRTNADAVWRGARTADDAIGVSWAGPPTRPTRASHASATLLLLAAAALDQGQPAFAPDR